MIFYSIFQILIFLGKGKAKSQEPIIYKIHTGSGLLFDGDKFELGVLSIISRSLSSCLGPKTNQVS